jgi:hypothetical protein
MAANLRVIWGRDQLLMAATNWHDGQISVFRLRNQPSEVKIKS